MESQPENNKSSMAVRVIAIVIVLLLVVGGMYGAYLYGTNQTQKKSDDQVAALQSQIDELKKQPKVDMTEPQKDQTMFFVIKEWNVKVPIDSEFSKLSYTIETIDATEYAAIVATELAPTDKCVTTPGTIGTISRSKTAPTGLGGVPTESKKVGEYYYSWSSIQNSCNSKADLEESYSEQLATAVKSVQATE